MNKIESVKEIVLEVDEEVKRVYYTNKEIEDRFGKRSAKQILYDENTCFMNPCLDLTLVSSYLMSSRDIQHQFLIEEHLPTKEFPFNRLHFALEFQDENRLYTINYKKDNEVYISEGNYNGREDIPSAQIIRIPGDEINPFRPLYKSLGYETLDDLIKDKFKGYSLESNLNRLKQDNSIVNFLAHKKEFGDKFKIIIER